MAQAKTLSKAELKQLIDVTKSCNRFAERDVTMLLLTHLCGMRVGEVAALRVSDVLSANGTVRSEIQLTAQQTKHNHARRVFVPKQMQRQLQHYVDNSVKQPTQQFLFPTQKSARFSANTAAQHLQRLYARAAIDGATSHSGRRTWLTKLSQRGVSVFVLAELAGHRSIQTTQRYVTVNDEMKRNAAELI